MPEQFVTIYTNFKIAPIDLAKSALESENIVFNIKGYDSSGEGQSQIIELQVPEKYRAKAEEIIKELNIK